MNTVPINAAATRYYYPLTILGVVFAIICIPTAGKMVDVFGIPLSIAIFYFPIIYVIADLMTEVYGYALARRALWYSIFSQILAVVVFACVALVPPSVIMQNNEAFYHVLRQTPRIVGFGIVAIFVGDIVNNYIVAKMKLWNQGRYMAMRFVISTVAAELINTTIFFTCALGNIMPTNILLQSILLGTVAKTIVEIIMLPFTIMLTKWVKQAENLDVFDRNTDFNPLAF